MISEALRAEEHFFSNPESRFRYLQAELEKFLSSKRENFFMSKGREQGRAEGVSIGEAKKNLENAYRMLGLGVDMDIISQTTGLSEGEIRNKT